MSWVKNFQPNQKEIEKIYKGYQATLTEQREKARKSNKLTRKDYTNL